MGETAREGRRKMRQRKGKRMKNMKKRGEAKRKIVLRFFVSTVNSSSITLRFNDDDDEVFNQQASQVA